MALTGATLRTIPCPGTGNPRDLAIDGKSLWVTSQNDSKIYQIHKESGAILKSVNAPSSNPGGIDVIGEHLLGDFGVDEETRDGQGALLLTDWNTNTLRIVSKDGKELRVTSLAFSSITLPMGVVHIGGSRVLVTAGGAPEPQNSAVIDFGNSGAVQIDFASLNARRGGFFDGHYVWLSSTGGNNFKKIDITKGAIQVIGSITNPMPNVPSGAAWDGRSLWSINPTTMLINQIVMY